MHKEPIKFSIGLGFAGVLGLMSLISFISLSQMNNITEQMSSLLTETNNKIIASNAMRDNIRLRGDTLYSMYLTDDYIERDSYRLKLAEQGLNYKNARDTLHSYRLDAREAKLLNQLVIQTRSAKAANDTAAEKLLSNLPNIEVTTSLHIANEARNNMLISMDKLVTLQKDIIRSKITEAKKNQETIGNIILLLSLAAFFIAVFIAQLIVRETTKKNSEIHYQATHDDLTQLVNRKEFNHRLEKAFNTINSNQKNHALCFLDLDNFKTINDTCGHHAGDNLLLELSRLIKDNIRNHDTLARLGGDEFGLLLESCSLEKAIVITEGLVNLIKNHAFIWQEKKFHVGVSIGLVILNNETKSAEQALKQADIACYAAKDMGRNQVQIHGLNDDRIRKMQKELSWVADINESTGTDRFSLYLQSIKNIQTAQDATMYEVLLRLTDDDGLQISPGNYILAAERFSLMKDVDLWVIEQAFMHLSVLYKAIPDCNIQLFINISANSLTNQKFAEFVIHQSKRYNISQGAICLEISETNAVKNINQTADVIATLKQHDIRFSLDDFGSGMSSFSYLKKLPVEYLKIDGNIIKQVTLNTADKALVAAINQIGKVMKIKTIAKHVENAFTLNQLKEIGIDFAQGFYIDKPKHIDELTKAMTTATKNRSSKR